MPITKDLEKLLDSKNKLLKSIQVCCDSIEFWEERANEAFSRMDELENESFDFNEAHRLSLAKESEKILNRVNFENSQLDMLEAKILDLEDSIIKTLAKYAKKQKK
jgi:hypothetical protein|tara:strand:+ start:762 stop:1079 length:318 start_codon:yes stop_codon:yes gene_type:complete